MSVMKMVIFSTPPGSWRALTLRISLGGWRNRKTSGISFSKRFWFGFFFCCFLNDWYHHHYHHRSGRSFTSFVYSHTHTHTLTLTLTHTHTNTNTHIHTLAVVVERYRHTGLTFKAVADNGSRARKKTGLKHVPRDGHVYIRKTRQYCIPQPGRLRASISTPLSCIYVHVASIIFSFLQPTRCWVSQNDHHHTSSVAASTASYR